MSHVTCYMKDKNIKNASFYIRNFHLIFQPMIREIEHLNVRNDAFLMFNL